MVSYARLIDDLDLWEEFGELTWDQKSRLAESDRLLQDEHIIDAMFTEEELQDQYNAKAAVLRDVLKKYKKRNDEIKAMGFRP